jgi:hypothetical protein
VLDDREALRSALGPWRWMLIVDAYESETNIVAIASLQDGRAANRNRKRVVRNLLASFPNTRADKVDPPGSLCFRELRRRIGRCADG